MSINVFLKNSIRALVLSAVAFNTQGAPTSIATVPLATSPTTSVLPNIMYVLDDSGSMDWDFLPDWACSTSFSKNNTGCTSTGSDAANFAPNYLFFNNDFNGVYYNPGITYSPPSFYNAAGAPDTTTYPSMTGTSVATGGSAAATSAAPNWTAVKVDGYGIQSTSTRNLQDKASFYWTIIPGEYCNSANLNNCITTSTPSGSNTFPARLRWCNSNALTKCKATFGDVSNTYKFFRAPSPPTAKIALGCSSCTATAFSSIKINGNEILSATSASSATTTTVATSIATNINACTFGLSGNCQTVGYSASVSGSTVTITAPTNVAGNSAYTPVITKSGTGTMTVTPAAFAAAPFYASSTVPGSNLLTVIHPGNDSYVYPGTSAKATTRTDCAAATCTYAEEMTNFANWFAYYQTRMQMMKTAASMAFANIGSTFRVGYMSINNNTTKDFLNTDDFTAANKFAWYKKFFSANPANSTPLRAALATVGRLYGGKLNGSTLNGSTVVDPMQFSCQQNFTILSTDGYWNEPSNPDRLDGSTDIGQQDGAESRPFMDGASATYTKRTLQNLQTESQALQSTSQAQQRTQQVQISTARLQKQTSQLQTTTFQLQAQTSQLQKTTSPLQVQTTQLQKTTSHLQKQTTQLQKQITQLRATTERFRKCTGAGPTNPAFGTCTDIAFDCTGGTGDLVAKFCRPSAPAVTAGAATCTVGSTTNPATLACNSVVTSAYAGAALCTPTTIPDASGNTTQCQTVITTPFADTASACTVTTTPNASGNTTQCQYGPSSTAPASSCTLALPSSGPTTFSVINAVACNSVVTTAFANTSSTCAATTVPDASGNTTQCRYGPSTTAPASSCSTVAASSGPTFSVINAVACNTVVTSPFANAAACTATTTPDAGGNTKQCQYVAGPPTGAGSCTLVAASSGPVYTVANPTSCATVVTAAYANAASCTATTTPDASGNTTQCQYVASAFTNASTCTPVPPSSGPGFTVGTATLCQTTDTGSVVATSGVCTPSGPTAGATVTCPPAVTTGPSIVASCTPALASASNNFTRTTCDTNPPTPVQAPVASCTPVAATTANGFQATICSQVTTGPDIVSSCAAEAASSLNNWTATTCVLASVSGGISNTLSDVAQYYYATDLRTTALSNCTGSPVAPATSGNTLCSATTPDPLNNVPTSGLDGASWQHMTTFTLGLGATGFMQFSQNYLKDTGGDFFDVKNGTLANPTSGVCSWQAAGTACNWPAPVSNGQTTIDDLWHAAVNGRGSYFSATNPASLSSGLSSALSGVSTRVGGSAAATTSNPNITSGDNFVFSSTFTTNAWDGQLFRQQLDLTTGVTSAAIDWSARDQLDTNASRTIYTFSSGATNNLKPFTWTGLASDASSDQDNFTTPHISSTPPAGMTGLSQFCAAGATCLSAAGQTDASGQKLVDFIRGDSSNEGVAADPSKYYRSRTHRLGDIVDAEAVYVKASQFTYADPGYMGSGGFAERNNSRAGRVYAASNDGMLHAFDSTTGEEVWAYVPALVLPNLYKLADKDYANQHTFFLDGTPVAAEICPTAPATACTGATWKTILVGGLNRGGRGYYALDVTDPAAPKALWEFTHANMGFTFGNPEIAKLKDGTWVVMVTSGYNNIASTSWPGAGDGGGYLYVLNAMTGALIGTPIPTNDASGVNVGTATTPSGLARIRAYVENAMVDNTALRAYGGDLFGNVWRFDINGDIGPAGKEAQRLATLYSNAASTVPQPITVRPELGNCGDKKMVFIGTGRFLGQTDIDVVPGQQSMYGIKDKLDSTSYANPQASGSGFIQQTLTSTTCPAGTSSSVCTTGQSVRTASNNVVNLATDNGWLLNFLDTGERDNTDPTLGLATLAFNTNVPSESSCEIGGFSFRYFINYCTGAPIGAAVGNATGATGGVVAVRLGNALATRPVLVRLPSNAIVELTRMSDGTTLTSDVPIGPGVTATRRVSWRELTNEK